jgi:hypothetical protein
MTWQVLPNVVAMITSLAAISTLAWFAARMTGGELAPVARLIAVGVFFSVFLHAAVELAEMLGMMGSTTLMAAMSVLLSLGSISFCVAGVFGVRALR